MANSKYDDPTRRHRDADGRYIKPVQSMIDEIAPQKEPAQPDRPPSARPGLDSPNNRYMEPRRRSEKPGTLPDAEQLAQMEPGPELT